MIQTIQLNQFKLTRLGRINKLKELKGINFNDTDEDGKTVLHYAAIHNRYEIMEYILKKKVQVNKVSSEGKTALHYAVERINIEIVRLLLNSNADPKKKDAQGKIPYDYIHRDEIKTNTNLIDIANTLEPKKQDILKQRISYITSNSTTTRNYHVSEYIKHAKDFAFGNHSSLGIGVMIVNHYILQKLNKEYKKILWWDIDIRKDMQALKDMSLKQLTAKYHSIFHPISKEDVKKQEKILQWPHLPLIVRRKGSCVDTILVKTMFQEKKKKLYEIHMHPGKNKKQTSHTNITNYYTGVLRHPFLTYVLLTQFHMFRALQLNRYANDKNAFIERYLLKFMKATITELLSSDSYEDVIVFLLSRDIKANKKCFQMYARSMDTHASFSESKTLTSRNIDVLHKQFKKTLGRYSKENAKTILNSKKSTVIRVYRMGIALYRPLSSDKKKLLEERYNVKINNTHYMSHITKTKKTKKSIIYEFYKIMNKRNISVVFEVFRSNTNAIYKYLKYGFLPLGTTKDKILFSN